MSGIAVALLHVSLLTTGGQPYKQAHRLHVETGRPLVILVGADWCPACVVMKRSVIPQAQSQGVLSQVEFVEVNTDEEPELARRLMRGDSIPQLIVYHKAGDGWERRELTGTQSVEEIQRAVTPSILIRPE